MSFTAWVIGILVVMGIVYGTEWFVEWYINLPWEDKG